MAVQLIGNGGIVADVDANTRALLTRASPIDIGALGSYRISGVTGTVAAGIAGASPWFAFRWGDATRFAVIREVRVGLSALTGFTAGNGLIEMMAARSYTASDTGGTALTVSGNNAKLKTSMGTTLVTNIQIANTGTMTAGTRTLDANPLGSINFTVNATANSAQLVKNEPARIFHPTVGDGEWPLVLAQNEGFILRVTVPATGTWNGYVDVQWDERTAFP